MIQLFPIIRVSFRLGVPRLLFFAEAKSRKNAACLFCDRDRIVGDHDKKGLAYYGVLLDERSNEVYVVLYLDLEEAGLFLVFFLLHCLEIRVHVNLPRVDEKLHREIERVQKILETREDQILLRFGLQVKINAAHD